jgi:exonuclease SbcC
MIHNLRASVTFPINGIHLNVGFSLQPGVTAVTGPNGSGKTFTGSELPRYLLFGKAALRGVADDYKNLTATGTFTIAGKQFLIERAPNKEQISGVDGATLAVGSKAVTAYVEGLFGYGLAVFDICNASTQKNADMFSKMLPAARKRMVDRVVGLSSNETVEKACRAEATTYRREAEALTRQLRAPVQPVEPVSYLHSTEIEKSLQEGRSQRKQADAITARFRPIFQPQEPIVARPDANAIQSLENEQLAYEMNVRDRRRLQAILNECMTYDPDDWTEDQLIAAEARNTALAEIDRRGPKPTIPMEQLSALNQEWVDYDFALRQSNEQATCPKCGNTFRTGGELPPEPGYTKVGVAAEFRAHEAWKAGEVKIPAGPKLTPQQIGHARRARLAKERHDATQTELDALPILLDMSEPLKAMRQAAAQWATYDAGMASRERQLEANREAEKELRALGPVVSQETLDKLGDDLSEARVYEAARAEFDRTKAEFDRLSVEIREKLELAIEFTKGAQALADARATLKAYLAPSLSRVASTLIYEMTNGKLQSVVVDEDMEITVNGQRIETLSGAGVTVANIALRIGLGQVLVANTFSVFLGDEMDSDADDERREATTEAICNLKNQLHQIVLITHRDVSIADQVLNVQDITG